MDRRARDAPARVRRGSALTNADGPKVVRRRGALLTAIFKDLAKRQTNPPVTQRRTNVLHPLSLRMRPQEARFLAHPTARPLGRRDANRPRFSRCGQDAFRLGVADHVQKEEALQLADGPSAQRASDIGAQLENCYTEFVRTSWAFDALSDASTTSVSDDVAEEGVACTRPRLRTASLDTLSRWLLYATDLSSVQGWHRMLNDQCARGGLAEDLDSARRKAGRLSRLSGELKSLVGNQLAIRGRALPGRGASDPRRSESPHDFLSSSAATGSARVVTAAALPMSANALGQPPILL